MPTKTQPRPDSKGRRLVQRAMYADEAYWIGLAAKLSGISMHEFVSRSMRKHVRSVLERAGIDPDVALAEANRNGG